MNDSTPRSPRGARLALVVAVMALGASLAQWYIAARSAPDLRSHVDDIARAQRRLNSLEDRIQRQYDYLQRLAGRIGIGPQEAGTLIGRLEQVEAALARMPGGEDARFLWIVGEAENFLRVANAQVTLAGNVPGALAALDIADGFLAEAADPRLAEVRRLVRREADALRALPRVDTEGMALELGALAASLPDLPRRQPAPGHFAPAPAPAPRAADGLERALAALRQAFSGIVSVRRTDEPTPTLLTVEGASLLEQTIELELQMARLALLRGDAAAFRAAIGAARAQIGKHYDTAEPAGAAAISALDELSGAKMPDALPEVSASLAELLRVKARETRP